MEIDQKDRKGSMQWVNCIKFFTQLVFIWNFISNTIEFYLTTFYDAFEWLRAKVSLENFIQYVLEDIVVHKENLNNIFY